MRYWETFLIRVFTRPNIRKSNLLSRDYFHVSAASQANLIFDLARIGETGKPKLNKLFEKIQPVKMRFS